MECHEGLRSKTTTFQYDVSNVQGFSWMFSIFLLRYFSIYLPTIDEEPQPHPLGPTTNSCPSHSFTLNGGFFTRTVQSMRAGAFGISSTSWEMTLGIPATVTCQNCDSAMRVDGAKIYNMNQYDTTSDVTSNVDMHDMPDHVLSVHNSYDYHDGSFCICSLEVSYIDLPNVLWKMLRPFII